MVSWAAHHYINIILFIILMNKVIMVLSGSSLWYLVNEEIHYGFFGQLTQVVFTMKKIITFFQTAHLRGHTQLRFSVLQMFIVWCLNWSVVMKVQF